MGNTLPAALSPAEKVAIGAGQFKSLLAPLLASSKSNRLQLLQQPAQGQSMQMFTHTTVNKCPKVKILTYNIWFEEVVPERLDSVLAIIEEADADFVCLQEMTHPIHDYFLQKSAYV